MTTPATPARRPALPFLLTLLVPLTCLVWAFWPTFDEMVMHWRTNPSYSHGYLVPLFAVFLLWYRRARLTDASAAPAWHDRAARWGGAALLAAGVGVRLAGAAVYYSTWLDMVSVVPCVAGVFLLVGGGAAARWAWPALGFLFFMVPLPYNVSLMMSAPLQTVATYASTFLMQTLGMPALAEGYVITLNEAKIGVVEACSGLRMLMVFFALSAAVTLVGRRPWVDNLIILASAIPIAVFANVLRITATGILHSYADSQVADAFFHDWAGYLMMPLALGVLAVELKVMSWVFLDAPPAGLTPRPVTAPPPTRALPAAPRPTAPAATAPRPRRRRFEKAEAAPAPDAAPPADATPGRAAS